MATLQNSDAAKRAFGLASNLAIGLGVLSLFTLMTKSYAFGLSAGVAVMLKWYGDCVGAFQNAVDPLLARLVAALDGAFHVKLAVNPHWGHIFVVAAVLCRSSFNKNMPIWTEGLSFSLMTISVLQVFNPTTEINELVYLAGLSLVYALSICAVALFRIVNPGRWIDGLIALRIFAANLAVYLLGLVLFVGLNAGLVFLGI